MVYGSKPADAIAGEDFVPPSCGSCAECDGGAVSGVSPSSAGCEGELGGAVGLGDSESSWLTCESSWPEPQEGHAQWKHFTQIYPTTHKNPPTDTQNHGDLFARVPIVPSFLVFVSAATCNDDSGRAKSHIFPFFYNSLIELSCSLDVERGVSQGVGQELVRRVWSPRR